LSERATVACSVTDPRTKERLTQVARPNCISKTLRKAGVTLMLSPDPITDVPGAIMLGASFVTRKNNPLSPASVLDETRKMLSEISSLL